MSWLRNHLRAWLGISLAQERADLALKRIGELEKLVGSVISKSAELSSALQQVNEVREMIQDPKRQAIKTRSFQQFRNLVEQEP